MMDSENPVQADICERVIPSGRFERARTTDIAFATFGIWYLSYLKALSLVFIYKNLFLNIKMCQQKNKNPNRLFREAPCACRRTMEAPTSLSDGSPQQSSANPDCIRALLTYLRMRAKAPPDYRGKIQYPLMLLRSHYGFRVF